MGCGPRRQHSRRSHTGEQRSRTRRLREISRKERRTGDGARKQFIYRPRRRRSQPPRRASPLGLRPHAQRTHRHMAQSVRPHTRGPEGGLPGRPDEILLGDVPRVDASPHIQRRRRPLSGLREGVAHTHYGGGTRLLRRLQHVGHLPHPPSATQHNRPQALGRHDEQPRSQGRAGWMATDFPLLEQLHGRHDRRPLHSRPGRCAHKGRGRLRHTPRLPRHAPQRLRKPRRRGRLPQRHGASRPPQLSTIWLHPAGRQREGRLPPTRTGEPHA